MLSTQRNAPAVPGPGVGNLDADCQRFDRDWPRPMDILASGISSSVAWPSEQEILQLFQLNLSPRGICPKIALSDPRILPHRAYVDTRRRDPCWRRSISRRPLCHTFSTWHQGQALGSPAAWGGRDSGNRERWQQCEDCPAPQDTGSKDAGEIEVLTLFCDDRRSHCEALVAVTLASSAQLAKAAYVVKSRKNGCMPAT